MKTAVPGSRTVPTLVLLPGMDGTGILFKPLLRSLSQGIRPIVVSYPPDVPKTYAELLPLVRHALPVHDPYVLLGESFSGPLAIMAASERPPNLKALILCGSFIRNPVPWLPDWFRRLPLTPFFLLSRPFVLAKALLAGYGSPEVLSLLRQAHTSLTPAVMARRAKEILGVQVGSQLRNISVPVHFLGGADDRVSPARNLRDIQRERPDIRVALIPGPHLILQTKPDESAAVIDAIMRKAL